MQPFNLSLLTLISIILPNIVVAQKPSTATEAIHIHTDKEKYLPGDTVWFKAYLMQDGLPGSSSTVLFANLFDETGKNLAPVVSMPVIDNTANGSFLLPDTINSSAIVIQAYTSTFNDSNAYHYTKSIPLLSFNNTIHQTLPVNNEQRLVLFAEGGNLVEEVPNYIAFKATSSDGRPVQFSGSLKSSNNDTPVAIQSMHNGMGIFTITPHASIKYFIEWKNANGVLQQTSLPAAVQNSIAMHIEQVGNLLYYIVQNPVPVNNLEELHVTATLQNELVHRSRLKMDDLTVLAGKIDLTALPAGVLQITISDKNDQPLAERVVLINREKLAMPATIAISEKNINAKGKNTIDISITDTMAANLSLSVFDAAFAQVANNANIFSDLLLAANIRGYIHEPGWYFTDTSNTSKAALDLVMLTHGWRRYRYDTTGSVAPANYLSIKGLLTNNHKQLLPNEKFTMIVSKADSSKNWYQLTSDQQGHFAQEGLIFYDTASVFFRLNNPDKMKVYFDAPKPFMPHVLALTTASFNEAANNSSINDTTGNGDAKILPQLMYANKPARQLQNVTVKGYEWRNDHMLKMDEQYTSGVFRGGGLPYQFDLLNDPMALAKYDVYNYLSGKMMAFQIDYSTGKKRFNKNTQYLLTNRKLMNQD